MQGLLGNGWLAGEVKARWEKAGRRNWDIETTISECQQGDGVLQRADLNPAPCFREARLRVTLNTFEGGSWAVIFLGLIQDRQVTSIR